MAEFYLDNDVAMQLARDLDGLGHFATHARHQRLDRAPDFTQLLHAASNQLTLVTHNAKDYRLLHGAWLAWPLHFGVEWTHAGILVIPQARWTTEQCALEIDQVVGAMSNLDNEILRWTAASGWIVWS